jgi:hypothetical protein
MECIFLGELMNFKQILIQLSEVRYAGHINIIKTDSPILDKGDAMAFFKQYYADDKFLLNKITQQSITIIHNGLNDYWKFTPGNAFILAGTHEAK